MSLGISLVSAGAVSPTSLSSVCSGLPVCVYIPMPHIPWPPKQHLPSPIMSPITKPLPCSCTPSSPAVPPAPLLSTVPRPRCDCLCPLCPSRASRAPVSCQCGIEPALLSPAWPTSCTSPLLAMAMAQGPTSSWRALWPASPAMAPCLAAPVCGQPSSTWWVTCCRASVSSWLPPSSTSRCLGWTAPVLPVVTALPVPPRVPSGLCPQTHRDSALCSPSARLQTQSAPSSSRSSSLAPPSRSSEMSSGSSWKVSSE